MTPGRGVLLAGATGLVGGHCLDLLLADPGVERVTVLARRRLARTNPKLRSMVIDFADPAAAGNALAADEVHCCIGTTLRAAGSRDAFRRVDHQIPIALARAARARGVRCFCYVSSLGADPAATTFYLKVKGEVERDLAALGFPSLVLFRPSLLLGERDERRPAERVGQVVGRMVGPLLIGPLRRYRPVPARTVARAMVRMGGTAPAGVTVLQSEQIVRIGRAPPAP